MWKKSIPEKQMILRFVPSFSTEPAPKSMLDFGTFKVDLGESEKSRLGGVIAEGAMMDESSQTCMLDWKKWRLVIEDLQGRSGGGGFVYGRRGAR